MNIAEIKTLLISAKKELNSMLSLNRTKQIKYEESKYFDLVTFLSLWNVASEDGSKIVNVIDDVPSGDALMQQLQKLDLEIVEAQFDSVFEKQFKKMFKKKKKPKVVAIIDVHEQETYCKDKRTNPYTPGGKHKNGTNFFFKFATIQILHKNKVLTLKVKILRRKQPMKTIVAELVKTAQKFVKIKTLLLDRGFRDVNIFNELEFLQVPVLMPCIKDDKTKKEFDKTKGKYAVVKYWWKNIKGEYADFKLIMMKLNNEKEIGFYTTIKHIWLRTAKYFLRLYSKRWNIETGYRLQNQFLPKTTCINGIVRYFYFCYAVAMHNLWLTIKNTIAKTKITVTTLKFILTYTWITTHLSLEL
ncbi:MAG: hypothetical protein ABIH21_04735 [Patescibacteria group bacterium]